MVLGGKVLDLGLEGFEEAVTRERQYGRIFDLEVGPLGFQCRFSVPDWAFIMHWAGRTSLANIIWTRFVAFRLRWPPFRSVSCFTYSWKRM